MPLSTGVFVQRPCEVCGRDTHLYDRDPKNSGLRIQKGDRVTFSGHFLKNMLRLVGGGRFSKVGLNMFARGLFVPERDIVRQSDTYLEPLLDAWRSEADEFIKASSNLAGLDVETEAGTDEAVKRLFTEGEGADSAEAWAFLMMVSVDALRDAIAASDVVSGAGAGVMLSSSRAMFKYKTELEEAVWRGHSVEGLRSALQEWENNRKNDNEEFWQQMLSRHSFVLAQALATPAIVLAGKAYVGGKAVENIGGNLADFLLRNELTHRTTLVELKVPTTELLAPSYRNHVHPPSAELVSAVAQVMTYAAELAEDPKLGSRRPDPFDAVRSECVVVVGTTEELSDHDRRRSFDLYRAELRTVHVVTYDELFSRVAALLRLFGG